MKPNTTVAMQQLIEQIRTALSMDHINNEICTGQCKVCPTKLVEYINMELENWEYRLQNGEIPNFKDLSKLAKTSHKVYKALDSRGLLE